MNDSVALLRALEDDRWRVAAQDTTASPAGVARPPPPPPPLPPPCPSQAVDTSLGRCIALSGKQVEPTVVQDARDVATKHQLDAYKQSLTGTYQTKDGKTLQVAAPFQLGEGYANQVALMKGEGQVQRRDAAAASARLSPAASAHVTSGRGTPDDMHALTQALLDAQPPGKIRTAGDVRQLMFDNGVGIDCAGYVQQAYLSVTGKTRMQAGFAEDPSNESLSNLAHRGFSKVQSVADLRPGDIVALGAPAGEKYGHRAIVYEQRLISPDEMRDLMTSPRTAQRDFTLGGRVRVIEVDSSWGAGHVDPDGRLAGVAAIGGVLRQTWLFNEGTQQWASWNKDTGAFRTGSTPYDHPVEGFFRGGRP